MSGPEDKESVSEIKATAEIRGKGKANLSFYRHLSPLTINALMRSLPIESRIFLQGPILNIFTNIKVGLEKPKTKYKGGDVAFLPLSSLLCIFLEETESSRPLNSVGKVKSGLDLLKNAKAGDVIILRADQEAIE